MTQIVVAGRETGRRGLKLVAPGAVDGQRQRRRPGNRSAWIETRHYRD
jgi:hypothetical protein